MESPHKIAYNRKPPKGRRQMNVEQIIQELERERDNFQDAINALSGARPKRKYQRKGRKRKPLSAAAKSRISNAMKKRWAARRAAEKK
jgi:hypothetical protein